MCGLVFSTAFIRNTSHSTKNWARYDQKCILVFMLSTHNSCPILMKLEFSQQFPKNPRISNFIKIRPVGVELIHAGTGTGMTKLTAAFRNFANAPKNRQFTWRPKGLGTGGHVTVNHFVNQATKPSNMYWVETCVTCTRGAQFDYQLGRRLYMQFSNFTVSQNKFGKKHLKSGHDRFSLHSFNVVEYTISIKFTKEAFQ